MFAAVAPDDTTKEVESMAAKVLKMKMWPDDAGGTVHYLVFPDFVCEIELQLIDCKWKRSVQDIKGEVLCGKSDWM